MQIILTLLGWLFGLLFTLLAVSMFLTGNLVRGLMLTCAALLALPPFRALILARSGKWFPWYMQLLLIVLLVGGFLYITASEQQTSIYLTPEAHAEHMRIYDQKLQQWPVPYETVFVDTTYGKMHVIISGPADGPPVLLLNAGQMAGWSWLPNVGALNTVYRTYAIDTIGEVGKSVLDDLAHFPQDGHQLSDLYIEVMDSLGLDKVYIVGASNGGFIAANIAIDYPERVEKLALLGPMGLTPATNENIVRITLAQFFPLKPVQDSTTHWAFGDKPEVLAQVSDWFRVVLEGSYPRQTPPQTIAAADLQKIKAPALLVMGVKDRLMGDLAAARTHAGNVPHIEIVEVDSGHLIGLDQPELSNQLIMEFFGRE